MSSATATAAGAAAPPAAALLTDLENKTNKAKWEVSWKGTPAWAHEELRKQHETNWAKIARVIQRNDRSDAYAVAAASGKELEPEPASPAAAASTPSSLVASPIGKRVLIPLSGDGPIIDYLLGLKYHVTAIEIVDRPIQQLLSRHEKELKLQKSVVPAPVSANVWSDASDRFTIHQGDFFTFPCPQRAGQAVLYDIVYDRAAFVAISPLRRGEYAHVLARMLKPNGYLFLDTLDRPFAADPLTEGPPFSASPKQIAPFFTDSDLWRVLSYEHLGWVESNPESKGAASRTNHQWVLQRTNVPAPAIATAAATAAATGAAPTAK